MVVAGHVVVQAGLGVVVLAGEAHVLGDAGVDGRGLAEGVQPGIPDGLPGLVADFQRCAEGVVVEVVEATAAVDAGQGLAVEVGVVDGGAGVFAQQPAFLVVAEGAGADGGGFGDAAAEGVVAVAGKHAAALRDAAQALVGVVVEAEAADSGGVALRVAGVGGGIAVGHGTEQTLAAWGVAIGGIGIVNVKPFPVADSVVN